MNLLLVGGSGLVGTAITPYLQPHHNLRVLDLNAPRHDDVEYVEGSIADPEAVRRALDGIQPDAAGADHHHVGARPDLGGVNHRTQAGDDAAGQEGCGFQRHVLRDGYRL